MGEKWIDFHCHGLPAMDDGSRSVEESLKMFRREAEQGVGIVIATPHFYAHQDRPETFLRRRDRAESALRQVWGPDLPRVGMGAEVTYFTGMKTCAELKELCIRGTNILLVEMPFGKWSEGMIQEIAFLQREQGYQVLLAHVERYLGFHNSDALDQLRAEGVRFQVNAGSFLRWQTRGKVLRLVKQGKLHILGSDCHNTTTRPPNLEEAIQYIEKECGSDTVSRLWRNSKRLLFGAAANQGEEIMTEQMTQTNMDQEEGVIDLLALAKYLLNRWFYLFLATAIAGMIAFVYTVQCITPMYSSSAKLYVNNGGVSFSGVSVGISSSDLMTSRNLVDTYVVILKDRQTLEEIIEKANLPYSYTRLSRMISASAVNNTEVLQITVTSPDPLEASQIANTVLEVLPNRITQIIDGCSVAQISGAIPMTTPVSPNVSRNTMMGAMVGFVLCAGLFVVMFLLDTQIHSEDYLLTTYPDIPVLTVVPTMDGSDRGGYGYGASVKNKQARKQ